MKELFENTWAIEDMGVRIFLLTGKERALVIDTGMTGIGVPSEVRKHTDLPFMLMNTHADRDHVAGNDRFSEFYMHPSEAAFYHNVQKGTGKIIPVFDGDEIDLGGRILEIIHLPGHTPGSITVLDRNSLLNYAHEGDNSPYVANRPPTSSIYPCLYHIGKSNARSSAALRSPHR